MPIFRDSQYCLLTVSNRRRVQSVLVGVLVVAAAAFSVFNLWRYHIYSSPTPPVGSINDWQSYAEAGLPFGKYSGTPSVVVFNDYMCAACKRLSQFLDSLDGAGEVRVSVTYIQKPRLFDQRSVDASLGAYCAAEQSVFMNYHRVLFAADSLNDDIVGYANASGVPDSLAFISCMGSSRVRSALAADSALGANLSVGEMSSVTGTPTLIISGDVYEGIPRHLDQLLEKSFASARR